MKYLVLSDIHGSIINIEKVLKEVTFDKLLLLGDILPHGPRNDLPVGYNPKKLIDLLNPLKDKIICVRGNCDAEVDDMVLEFPILDLALINIGGINFYLTHGHKFNYTKPLNVNSGVVLYGHTHVKRIDTVNGAIYINPGSLSIPKDNSASYMIIEDCSSCVKISIYNIDGTLFNEMEL